MTAFSAAKTGVHFLRRNFDDVAILSIATKLAFAEDPTLSEEELAVVVAMQRAHPQAGGDPEALGAWLAEMDPSQIDGVVNNTKGVLHEMEFVRFENGDGDSIHAALFDDTNHAHTDVSFVDSTTGATWEAQLKATDDTSYVQEWVDAHPDGEILVTEELSTSMGLESTGLENGELTARTEEVVDKLVSATDDDSMWDYFPALTATSVGLIVWEAWKRHRTGDISLQRFKWIVAKTTGLKAGKLALLSLAMTIPVVNVVTGAVLVARLVHSVASESGNRTRPHPIRRLAPSLT